jgi:hypothetical protein
MKKLYAIVISLLFVGSFFGIASIFGAQYISFGTNNYKVYDADYKWIEINGTGTEITDWTETDDGYTTIPVGFDFPFYGKNYNELYLSTNGHIDFVEGKGNPGRNYSGAKIPSESGSEINDGSEWGENPLIAFYFCDFDFDKTEYPNQGHAYYKDFGDYFVIEIENVPMYMEMDEDAPSFMPTPGVHTMQAILYKNGNIKLQYKELTNKVDHYEHAAVIGLDYDNATGVSYDGPIRNGLALWFTTGADQKTLPIAQILKILKENQED